jgi:MSHA pilin protein MshD
MKPSSFFVAKLTSSCPAQRGFTLIEVVVGISIIGLTTAMFMAGLMPLMTHSVDPQFQARAAEYAQAMMKEVQSMPYDELTPLGEATPCGPCTPSAALGVDVLTPGVNESRSSYDDVDDYHDSCGQVTPHPVAGMPDIPGIRALDMTAQTIDADGNAEGLVNYFVRICVQYDGDYDGNPGGGVDPDQSAKLISITVMSPDSTAPDGFVSVNFHAYRSNY